MQAEHAVYVPDPATAHNDNHILGHKPQIEFDETVDEIVQHPQSVHAACLEKDGLQAAAPLGKNPEGISEYQRLFTVAPEEMHSYSRDVLSRQFDHVDTTKALHKSASADNEYVAILHSGGKSSRIDYLGFTHSGHNLTVRDCAYTGPLDAANDRSRACRVRHFVLKDNAV